MFNNDPIETGEGMEQNDLTSTLVFCRRFNSDVPPAIRSTSGTGGPSLRESEDSSAKLLGNENPEMAKI